MARQRNTDRNGNAFTAERIREVWEKGTIDRQIDESGAYRRRDACGALIEWDEYDQNEERGYGWEIDHIKPVAEGGDDDIDNLQPLHWQNNRAKGDLYPVYQKDFCEVIS